MFSPGSRLKLSPTAVIASLALFFALGGGAAVAAQQFINGSRITPHTIGLKQLTPKAIATLEAGVSETTPKTTVTGSPGTSGAAGSTGPAGKTGATGPAGPAGLPASASTLGEVVVTDQINFEADSGGDAEIDCPAGKVAIAGGGGLGLGTGGGWNGVNTIIMSGSSPHFTKGTTLPTGWDIEMENEIQFPVTFPVYAVCINP